MALSKTIPDTLRTMRMIARVSQADAARKIGIERNSVSRKELGKISMTAHDIDDWLDAIDATPQEFARELLHRVKP